MLPSVDGSSRAPWSLENAGGREFLQRLTGPGVLAASLEVSARAPRRSSGRCLELFLWKGSINGETAKGRSMQGISQWTVREAALRNDGGA